MLQGGTQLPQAGGSRPGGSTHTCYPAGGCRAALRRRGSQRKTITSRAEHNGWGARRPAGLTVHPDRAQAGEGWARNAERRLPRRGRPMLQPEALRSVQGRLVRLQASADCAG